MDTIVWLLLGLLLTWKAVPCIYLRAASAWLEFYLTPLLLLILGSATCSSVWSFLMVLMINSIGGMLLVLALALPLGFLASVPGACFDRLWNKVTGTTAFTRPFFQTAVIGNFQTVFVTAGLRFMLLSLLSKHSQDFEITMAPTALFALVYVLGVCERNTNSAIKHYGRYSYTRTMSSLWREA